MEGDGLGLTLKCKEYAVEPLIVQKFFHCHWSELFSAILSEYFTWPIFCAFALLPEVNQHGSN